MKGTRTRSPLLRATAAGLLAGTAVLSAGCGSREPDVIAGKQLFVQRCGACHVLGRAGTKGQSGPNLDEAFQQAQKEGFGESAIRGIVKKQIEYPFRGNREGVEMPANIVSGRQAEHVAAYVAQVVSAKGKDTGLLATAVKQAGGGKPVAAKGGKLSIPADPGGQLAFVSGKASASAGKLEIDMPNESPQPHNIVIDGLGAGKVVEKGGSSSFTATVKAGSYTYYCAVPGHRAGGMEGKLTVK
jgi:mono/diheme cytochrome c family protein